MKVIFKYLFYLNTNAFPVAALLFHILGRAFSENFKWDNKRFCVCFSVYSIILMLCMKTNICLFYTYKITTAKRFLLHHPAVAIVVLTDIILFEFVAPAKFNAQNFDNPWHSAEGHEDVQNVKNQQVVLCAISYITHDWTNYKHCVSLRKHKQAVATGKSMRKKIKQ